MKSLVKKKKSKETPSNEPSILSPLIGNANLVNDVNINVKNVKELTPRNKAILRAFKGRQRMSQEQYELSRIEYNAFLLNKDVSPQAIKDSKLSRKAYQSKQATKKQYNKLIKDFSKEQSKYVVKINKQIPLLKTIQNSMKAFEDKYPNKLYNLVVNGKYYAVNDNTRKNLFKAILNSHLNIIQEKGSDAITAIALRGVTEFYIEVFEKTNQYNKNNGAFFKYYHNIAYDLSRYQIFPKQSFSYNYTFDNCLIYALKQGGCDKNKLEQLKLLCSVDNIPICKLNEICINLDICIELTRPKYNGDSSVIKTEIYGNATGKDTCKATGKEIYKIGLLDEHFFLNEPTELTAYCINNYETVKHCSQWNLIIRHQNNYFKRDRKRCISSYDVINLLLKNKVPLLEPINKTDVTHHYFYKKTDDTIQNLEYTPEENVNYRVIKLKEQKDNDRDNIFFDFETYTDVKTKIHIPYLCCYTDDNGKSKSFIGNDCGLQMLKYLSKVYTDVRMIAHNASYDIRFLYQYLQNIKEIEKSNKLIACQAKFNNLSLEFKDSYLLISMPLSKFSKTFKINNCVKEVISYNFYNDNSISIFTDNKHTVLIEDFEKYLLRENKSLEQFRDNINKWNLIENKIYFNCVEYSKRYCLIDCDILREGYNTFKQWLNELCKINIDNILTIASLAHRYFIQQGCYDDVYELSGITQSFIQKCVVGGRTMISQNKKCKFQDIKIVDFDAVSLYPSAMYRMDGFLKGLPKVISDLNFENIKSYDGYFIEIEIKSVGKQLNFPLASFIDENGVRQFTNELTGKRIYIDKIALEDLIKFQDVTFDVIRGYYFNEGFNTEIKNTIKILFEERKKLKKEHNPAEMVYKLIMNSGYGKSIMKEVETETKYFNDQNEMNVFISRNHNWVINYEQMSNSNSWKVNVLKPINNHFNIAHVGVSILSWSKRIMNEVMTLAEDNNIPIFYQDTDSNHMLEQDVNKLATLFKQKYGKELIGKELGQFHSDFELEGCNNVYATDSIFLGKKCYIDKLCGTDNVTGEIKHGYHIRMKGVDNGTIYYTAEKLNIDVFELYMKLYDGEAIEFDLTQGGTKHNFKFHSNGSITTLNEFFRVIQFRQD
jgi:hypothetical protein